MPRIHLAPLGHYLHSFNRRVTVTDLNYLAHLDHSSVIRIAHEARVDFFHKYGISERNMIVGDLACQYQQPSELFDDLQVDTALGEPSRCGFRMFHQIRARIPLGSDGKNRNKHDFVNPTHATGSLFRPIALVEMGMVAIDAKTKAPVEIPVEFYHRLGIFWTNQPDPASLPLTLPPLTANNESPSSNA